MSHTNLPVWIGRILVGIVLVFNVQCALAFLIAPKAFAPSFEMSGTVGAGIVRGLGVLFLMWNVPYVAAGIDPTGRRFSLYEAIAMQTIGFLGESLMLTTFPQGHPVIEATLGRFILFDGLGLLALAAAAWVTRSARKT